MGEFFDISKFRVTSPERVVHAPEDGRMSVVPKWMRGTRGNLEHLVGNEFPDSSVDRVASNCRQLAICRDTGCGGSEPLWHALAGIAKHCVDGTEMYHEWSSQYNGYDERETQGKLDNWSMPPTTCAKFREINPAGCRGCVHKGRITSPISLGYEVPQAADVVASKVQFSAASGRPKFVPGGMPPREFAGPIVKGNARLFPLHAMSAFASLGGGGKTSVVISLACHIAAGKRWNNNPVQRCKVIVFCVEELKEELDRKFSATVEHWSDEERTNAEEYLLFFSCLDIDARLTKIERGQYSGTGVAEEMIAIAKEHGAQLIVIDHLQGFVSGDLNVSETATTIARECNKIVAATGAAVVLTAHVSKANIGTQEIGQGFAVGSLAFENAARQLVGIIPIPDADAKTFGIDQTKSEYIKLVIPKNSYGPPNVSMFFKREYSPSYHTVTMAPITLAQPIYTPRKTSSEALCDKVIEYLKRHPMTTSNALDLASGDDGFFKCGKTKVRTAAKSLLETGAVTMHIVTPEDRVNHVIGKNVTQYYEVSE